MLQICLHHKDLYRAKGERGAGTFWSHVNHTFSLQHPDDVKSGATIKRCVDEHLSKRRNQLENHETGREDLDNATILLLDEFLQVIDDVEKNKQTPAERRQAAQEKERQRHDRQLDMLQTRSSRSRRDIFEDEDDGLDNPPSAQVSFGSQITPELHNNDDLLRDMAHRIDYPVVTNDELQEISTTQSMATSQSSTNRSREWADDEERERKKKAKSRRNKTEIRQELNKIDDMFNAYLENSTRHTSAMEQLVAHVVGSSTASMHAGDDGMHVRMTRMEERMEESSQEVKKEVADVKSDVAEIKNVLQRMAAKILDQ